MYRYLFVSIGLLFLLACAKYERIRSYEPATVVQTIYQAGSHGTGFGVGISSNGSVTPTITDIDIPPKWVVVFRCRHGRFVVEGTERKHRELWKRLTEGQEVLIIYDEVYRVEDDARTLTEFDFIDAKPKEKTP